MTKLHAAILACALPLVAALRDEDSARAARRGIWHFDPLPIYPWGARHPVSCQDGVLQ